MSFLDKFQPREPQTAGVGDTPLNAQYTPDRIASLGPNDFLFLAVISKDVMQVAQPASL